MTKRHAGDLVKVEALLKGATARADGLQMQLAALRAVWSCGERSTPVELKVPLPEALDALLGD